MPQHELAAGSRKSELSADAARLMQEAAYDKPAGIRRRLSDLKRQRARILCVALCVRFMPRAHEFRANVSRALSRRDGSVERALGPHAASPPKARCSCAMSRAASRLARAVAHLRVGARAI
jgi:hypothetical protein